MHPAVPPPPDDRVHRTSRNRMRFVVVALVAVVASLVAPAGPPSALAAVNDTRYYTNEGDSDHRHVSRQVDGGGTCQDDDLSDMENGFAQGVAAVSRDFRTNRITGASYVGIDQGGAAIDVTSSQAVAIADEPRLPTWAVGYEVRGGAGAGFMYRREVSGDQIYHVAQVGYPSQTLRTVTRILDSRLTGAGRERISQFRQSVANMDTAFRLGSVSATAGAFGAIIFSSVAATQERNAPAGPIAAACISLITGTAASFNQYLTWDRNRANAVDLMYQLARPDSLAW